MARSRRRETARADGGKARLGVPRAVAARRFKPQIARRAAIWIAARRARRPDRRRAGYCRFPGCDGAGGRPPRAVGRREQAGRRFDGEHPAQRPQDAAHPWRRREQRRHLRVGQQALQLTAMARRRRRQPDQPAKAARQTRPGIGATARQGWAGLGRAGAGPGGTRGRVRREWRRRRTGRPCGAAGPRSARSPARPAPAHGSPPRFRTALRSGARSGRWRRRGLSVSLTQSTTARDAVQALSRARRDSRERPVDARYGQGYIARPPRGRAPRAAGLPRWRNW